MRNLRLLVLVALLVPVAAVAGEQAVSAESIRVVKTSPMDEKAVIKVHGKLQVIKVGDELSAIIGQQGSSQQSAVGGQQKYELKVVEIAKDRVVLEETGESGPETLIIRLEEGKQKVERMRKSADKQQHIYKAQ